MRQHVMTWAMILLFVVVLSVPSAAGRMDALAEALGQEDAAPAAGPTALDETFKAYGFVFEQYDDHDTYGRFTNHEMDVLGSVIVAFADLAGGPKQLAALVNGPVHVRRDLHGAVSYTQAGGVIGLGRGAFDLALTTEGNYYTWGARSGDELAQIVFGHEIGHRWIEALRRQDAKDWGDVYGRNVWRGERAPSPSQTIDTWITGDTAGGSPADPEEEAVTNLALFALGRRYRWTFLHDAPASERRQVWVDGWVSDLLANNE